MKHLIRVTVLLAFAGIFAAACGSTVPNPLGSTTGSGGTDPSGGGQVVSSVGSSTTATGSTSTGGDCKIGGVGCQASSECCSGACANDVCTSCTEQGQSCGEGCCQGLTCLQGKCGGTCAADNSACTVPSDCCSNKCIQGTCAQCTADGDACLNDVDCCGGTCTNSACGPCSGSCILAFQGGSDASKLCNKEGVLYDALYECTCLDTCASACGDNACQGNPYTQACTACLMNTSVGCGQEFNACAAN
jgi:hypothetical protein